MIYHYKIPTIHGEVQGKLETRSMEPVSLLAVRAVEEEVGNEKAYLSDGQSVDVSIWAQGFAKTEVRTVCCRLKREYFHDLDADMERGKQESE